MRRLALVTLLLLSACASPDAGPLGGGRPMGGRVPLSLAGEMLGRPTTDEDAYAAAVVEWAKAIDSNHDGFISPDELKADVARFHALVDTDKDGSINARELGDYRLARLAALRRGGGRGDRPDGPPPDGPEGAGGPRGEHGGRGPGGVGMGMGGGAGTDKVMEADRNLDFRVTLEELQALALERLRALDSDKDGRTSLAEIRAGAIDAFNERPARIGGRRGGGHGGGGHGGGGPQPD